jgi:hypothetical protein
MILLLAIVGLWLGAAMLVYGLFVHRRFGIGESLRRFPVPGLVAAAVLAPGALAGAHFVLPMPPALALVIGIATLNSFSVVLNAVLILIAGVAFFAVSWWLNRRAAAASG